MSFRIAAAFHGWRNGDITMDEAVSQIIAAQPLDLSAGVQEVCKAGAFHPDPRPQDTGNARPLEAHRRAVERMYERGTMSDTQIAAVSTAGESLRLPTYGQLAEAFGHLACARFRMKDAHFYRSVPSDDRVIEMLTRLRMLKGEPSRFKIDFSNVPQTNAAAKDVGKRPAIEAATYNANRAVDAGRDKQDALHCSLSAIAFALIAIHEKLDDAVKDL